ncbi:MAG TPA: type II secretion system F family protein [Verrucomicrobiae bacterium]|nr:type II secretion system F family protein [Verrucomicrobiae bacterium]
MNGTDTFIRFLEIILLAIAWLIFWAGPAAAFLFGAFLCWSIPLRRRERARLALDLIENGARDGHTAEETLRALSECRDRTMGARFHMLAAHIARGCRLGEALDRVPRLMPPAAARMLKVGEQIGDLRKVFPACRQLLRDAESQTVGAMNYLMVFLAYFVTPVGAFLLGVVQIYVMPQFLAVADGMEVTPPAELTFLHDHKLAIVCFEIALVLLVWVAAFLYVGGPRVTQWFRSWGSPLVDHLQYSIPWRRKRMQRDFSAMLAILLDSGMPEAEALPLAADCTVNEIFQHRAARATSRLREGMKLTEAVAVIDDSGEFRWRLTNACHAHGGFFRAIAGWNRSLDAKAFQQEQAAAQLITTALVAINGVIIGIFAVSVFRVLISIVNSYL